MLTKIVNGQLFGERLSLKRNRIIGMIVHIVRQYSQNGPAENAFIYIDTSNYQGIPRARYISWINLYDIENAGKRENGRWRLVATGTRFRRKVKWIPYGWGDAPFPSVADY